MRFVTRAAVAVAGLAVTVTLAGCGSTGGTLLSEDAANQLKSELTQASASLSADNCLAAASALTDFKSDVAQLTNLNATLVTMLNQGADTITSLAEQRCPTGATTTTTKTRTATTVTQPPTTTTTATTSSVTTSAPATITTVTPPGDGGATVPTAPVQTTSPVQTTPPAQTSTPDSGGAGLGGAGNTGNSGAGDSQGTDSPGAGGTP